MRKYLGAILAAVAVTGCATSPEELAATPTGSLCMAYARAVLNSNRDDWLREVYRRGETCAPYAAEMAVAGAQSQSMLNGLNQRYLPATPAAPIQSPMTAHLRNQYVQGFNRVCIYDRAGSPVHITIPATNLCPLTQ